MIEPALCGERVVIVEVLDGEVNLRTGRIARAAMDLDQPDHRCGTVVHQDRKSYPTTDISEEAFDKAFAADDIHLLAEKEARALQDSANTESWFGAIYQDWVVEKIHHALNRLPNDPSHP